MGGNPERGNDGWQQLSCIINDFNLFDPFRKLNPSLKQFTWSSQGVSCRLDRFYLSTCLSSCVQTIYHEMYTFSDHHAVMLSTSPCNLQSIGKSYWKFNSSLLQDEDFVDFMSCFLNNNVKNVPKDDNMLIWWDDFKKQMRSIIITYSINKKRRERYVMNSLRKEFFELEKQGKLIESKLIKDQIKQMEIDSMKGAQIRSKAYRLDGEKPSKYFLYKELSNNKKKRVKKIIDNNGTETEDSKEILNLFKDFYTDLFKFEPVDEEAIDKLLSDIPQVNESDKKMLNEKLTNDEIISSLKSFDNNKSPGPDGLSKEFYLKFIDILLPILSQLFNIIF